MASKSSRMIDPVTQDRPVSEEGGLYVIDAIRRMRQESYDAKRGRIAKNKRNRDVYFGRQDWSHKQPGQSSEFLPKVPMSVEQMGSFVKRGLIQFGDWFSVDLDMALASVIDGSQVRAVLKCFLSDLWQSNNVTTTAHQVIADVVKTGMLESLMIIKVHGGMIRTRTFEAGEEDEEPMMVEAEQWRLRWDLIRQEDYYPDPTGNGLYEIHRCERDLHEVIEWAEDGLYDMETVKHLIDTDYPRPKDEERSDRDRLQNESVNPSFRKRVVIDEFWGTILNDDGTVAHRNVVATVANDKYLIRPPEPNPFWHQESPFVVAPLVRVPWSVWHKALYDHASELNLSINEMFNLMLDGGLAAVWGVRQVRVEDLEDPSQVAGGIPQGATLSVKQTLPHNGKVVETVTSGEVPRDAMAVFEFLNREFTQAALTNELKLGTLPPKQVRATEVIEAGQSQSITLDGIIVDVESSFISPALRKSWLMVLQNMDDVPASAMTSAIDRKTALLLQRARPAERFALFAGKSQFRVNGLSATMQRALDFQKFMAMMQVVTTNPVLLQAFLAKFSPDKVLRYLMRMLNINPQDLEKDQAEIEGMGEELQRFMMVSGLMGGGKESGVSAPGAEGTQGAPPAGGSGVPAEINQLTNPLTGLAPAG